MLTEGLLVPSKISGVKAGENGYAGLGRKLALKLELV